MSKAFIAKLQVNKLFACYQLHAVVSFAIHYDKEHALIWTLWVWATAIFSIPLVLTYVAK